MLTIFTSSLARADTFCKAQMPPPCLQVDVRASRDLPVLVPNWQDGPPPSLVSLNSTLGRVGTLLFNCMSPKHSQADQHEFLFVMQQIKKFCAEAQPEPEVKPAALEDADAADPELVTFLERSDQTPMLLFWPGMDNIDQIMRTNIGTLHIERPVITRFVLSRDIIMSVMAHENRVTFSASWNGAWHTENRVQEVMDNCVDKVFRGLGLNAPATDWNEELLDQIPPLNAMIPIEPEVPVVIPGRRWIVPPIREFLGQYF
ncbi:hypothetical protein PgNI_05275 [Pyricularia grisea]|uniref:Uncharacterized protein n=1 Tax=Pyricularia grisea TaxID=148305 RepID=A0A6P8B5G1_PYRGI|nr:hypothetical protein PgNI_05275 [Pyricularia grisea]TLD10369.1 hypothetical protein PgNI_05275 [Pyricularia grisea]